MITTKKALPARLAGVIVVALVCTCRPAWAGSGALLQLLEVLHDNGTINDEAYAKLHAAAEAEQGSSAISGHATSKPAPGRGQESRAAHVDFRGKKVRIESAGRRFSFRLGGRVMADAARYDNDVNSLGDGSELRRVRLSWDATLARDWKLKSAVELTGGASLKSTYIDYMGLPHTYLRFGSDKEPVSLDWLSSSKYSTFMERAMLTKLVPGRHIGFMAGRNWRHWGVSGGVFGGEGGGQDGRNEGTGVTARLFYSPWHGQRSALHLGLSGSYRDAGSDHSIRFRARPESHVTDTRLVDTGTIANVNDMTWVGLESALVENSFSLQGEYLAADVSRSAGLPDLHFDGWYAYASWFLTGESRNYEFARGRFGRIRPRHALGRGGLGAFELGARFSRLDLTDDDVVGGVEDNLTLGLNWYATPNVRFMANYVKVLELDRPGSKFNGDRPSIFQIRGQADF